MKGSGACNFLLVFFLFSHVALNARQIWNQAMVSMRQPWINLQIWISDFGMVAESLQTKWPHHNETTEKFQQKKKKKN